MRRLIIVVLAALVVVVLVAAVLVGRALWDRSHRTDFSRALDLVPAAAKRVSFTDWAEVRRTLHVSSSADPVPSAVAGWLDRAYDKDLSAASSIDESGQALQQHYGFSPGNARWEAYAQSDRGATMVLRLDDDVDFDDVAADLTRTGYQQPDREDGVWRGGANLVASTDPTLSPELQFVVLLKDQHLVVTSDNSSYVVTAAKVARGKARSLADVGRASDMVGRLDEPAAAILWSGDFACSDLAMSQADEGDQSQADQLIARAGKVSALSGLVMALSPGGTLTVAEEFESSDQAAANLRARARLAVGEAVGRGESTFADDYRLTASKAVGSTVLLTMRARADNSFPLSSVYDGPVIFATC